ncbi:MAG: type II toxin-antitoxin system PemK/MazF family toxin [Mycobacteriaceae bacterium]
MDSTDAPHRGEVWLVSHGAGKAGAPGKTRPAVIVSVDALSSGASRELIVVVPLSSSSAPSALRVEIEQGAGAECASRAICRAVRAVVRSRIVHPIGRVTSAELEQIDSALSLILGLDRGPGPR